MGGVFDWLFGGDDAAAKAPSGYNPGELSRLKQMFNDFGIDDREANEIRANPDLKDTADYIANRTRSPDLTNAETGERHYNNSTLKALGQALKGQDFGSGPGG